LIEREVKQLPTLVKQQAQLQGGGNQLEETVRGIDGQLATFQDLGELVASAMGRREAMRPDYALYLEHQQSANSYKPKLSQWQEMTAKLENGLETLQGLGSQRSQLLVGFDLARVTALENAFGEAQRQVIMLGAQLPEKRKRLGDLQGQVEQLRQVEASRTTALGELKSKQRVDRFIKFARKAYKEAGPRITERYVQQVSREADRLFRELLNRPNVALDWTRDYEIIVREGANARRLVNLSGGEQMCAALAVRLALLKVLADVDVAFFDEPTTNMDRMRRLQLAGAIANIKTFKQLFVISHDDTFEQVTENVILVERVEA
jgi:DNA repair protein SbcC/Rad50